MLSFLLNLSGVRSALTMVVQKLSRYSITAERTSENTYYDSLDARWPAPLWAYALDRCLPVAMAESASLFHPIYVLQGEELPHGL